MVRNLSFMGHYTAKWRQLKTIDAIFLFKNILINILANFLFLFPLLQPL